MDSRCRIRWSWWSIIQVCSLKHFQKKKRPEQCERHWRNPFRNQLDGAQSVADRKRFVWNFRYRALINSSIVSNEPPQMITKGSPMSVLIGDSPWTPVGWQRENQRSSGEISGKTSDGEQGKKKRVWRPSFDCWPARAGHCWNKQLSVSRCKAPPSVWTRLAAACFSCPVDTQLYATLRLLLSSFSVVIGGLDIWSSLWSALF